MSQKCTRLSRLLFFLMVTNVALGYTSYKGHIIVRRYLYIRNRYLSTNIHSRHVFWHIGIAHYEHNLD